MLVCSLALLQRSVFGGISAEGGGRCIGGSGMAQSGLAPSGTTGINIS